MKPIIPTAELGSRIPEMGRIRLGVKTANAMRAIDTFRFTSPDHAAIAALADLYGGEPRPWSDPKASPSDQWEVITAANEIAVYLPPDALSVWYERWGGGGCERRCDGTHVEITRSGPDGAEPAIVDCLCEAEGTMTCRPYTRLSVIIPEVRFGGVWRLETKGWNAAHEMPAMEELIHQLQAHGIVSARLALTKRNQLKGGKKHNFVVPRLIVDASPAALLAGEGTASPAGLSASTTPQAALGPGSDDDAIEAEIVDHDDGPGPLSATEVKVILQAKQAAHAYDTDEDEFRHGLVLGVTKGRTTSSRDLTDDEVTKTLDILEACLNDEWVFGGYDDTGKVLLRRPSDQDQGQR